MPWLVGRFLDEHNHEFMINLKRDHNNKRKKEKEKEKKKQSNLDYI